MITETHHAIMTEEFFSMPPESIESTINQIQQDFPEVNKTDYAG
jgi:hypothetical protein